MKHSLSVILSMLQISNLKENTVYQFQVAAMNIAGVGVPSAVSECFKCEEWTIAVPGKLGKLSFFSENLQLGAKFKCYIDKF